ncbi:EamA family transporter RarD [Cytobacillus purgationiresistens]|uniref:Chloramphenicol-sensitive protein RarD n=1 Tax=Cytobacillus purgationiresistens TaxID=863449 RepID=A0ABU0ALG0_9BACI|nr:EamA family transporter RarD [Cytobacillus purgationiresistens]MDQ0272109.1 chloramphenicol-sensitive protein RarD [Cytobacillus purgationiresistens]
MSKEVKTGAFYAGFSYILWGVLPIYWKLLNDVSAGETLANRVVWSFAFMLILLVLMRKWGAFIQTFKGLFSNKKQLMGLFLASILISGNWYIFIWAVNSDRIIETSLGYYINPLISVLLGMLVFKEKLSASQLVSFILATVGVLILTISYGEFPWVSILLALTFGLYGLAKKMVKVDSEIGLTLETLVITPIAFIFIVNLFINDNHSLFNGEMQTDLLMMGAGVATAIPLLFFARGVQRIPLSMVGFLQYIAPTIMLILGVFVYGEYFSKVHLLSFIFIWISLTLYSMSKTKLIIHLESKWKKGNEIGL